MPDLSAQKASYDIEWLKNKFVRREPVEFQFFWGHSNPQNKSAGNFCFSQWYEAPFSVDGVTYKTAEHWMMARKALLFNDTETWEKIMAAFSPKDVKALGRVVKNFDDALWQQQRYRIVLDGNIHKFSQHSAFKAYLLATGDKVIVEASPTDAVWGIGLTQDSSSAKDPHTWRGLNLLGFALMETRDLLKPAKSPC